MRKLLASVIAAGFAFHLTACAAKKGFHFSPNEVTRIHYDAPHCQQIDPAHAMCNNVIFELGKLSAH